MAHKNRPYTRTAGDQGQWPTPQRTKKKPNIFVGPGQGLAERRKRMLDQFKGFDQEAASLDELISLSAFGKSLKAEFEARQIATPEYVDDKLSTIGREIDARTADAKARRIRDLKAQREGLKTAAEKREAIDKELAALGEAV